jgi:transglutaminase-like putative cysteine protease
VIYDLRHLTAYTYGAPVTLTRCTLRLLPGDGPGQSVLAAALTVTPEPTEIAERIGFFGNRVVTLAIAAPHQELRVEAVSRVRVERDMLLARQPGRAWETIREAAFAARSLAPGSPAHHLFPSRLVALHAPITAYARESFTPGRPVLSAATDLMDRIGRDFVYDPRATAISTPIAEAFASRRGVCQDFAHIMIAGLRGLGLPAAYVSGYIRTVPPPGQQRLKGADATHAWVSFWAGDECGWIGLDPTNRMLVGDDHVVLAVGRDYSDISPVDGIFLSSGNQDLDVEVDVVPAA